MRRATARAVNRHPSNDTQNDGTGPNQTQQGKTGENNTLGTRAKESDTVFGTGRNNKPDGAKIPCLGERTQRGGKTKLIATLQLPACQGQESWASEIEPQTRPVVCNTQIQNKTSMVTWPWSLLQNMRCSISFKSWTI